MLSKLDKAIIGLISRDIPLTKRPFKDLALRLGIGEDLLVDRMRVFKKKGLMRKFAASLNHRKIGFRYNAMVVWDVPQGLVDEAGRVIASFDEVSHCYQRRTREGWNYSLYAMIHSRTKKECLAAVKRISDSIGSRFNHRVLFSSKEEKKTGARFQ